jgi:hypothetical protein
MEKQMKAARSQMEENEQLRVMMNGLGAGVFGTLFDDGA